MSVEPDNPPGLSTLAWRVAPRATSLARMRAYLQQPGPDRPGPVRALAHLGHQEPVIAALDAWAGVADTVSFYTERIAQEGYLRTATDRRSVRYLARALGYELRPGVAAQVDLAFEVETAPGAPEAVVVPEGTPVQSVPGPDELPQTFETSTELLAWGAWNAIPALPDEPQPLGYGVVEVWLPLGAPTVAVDDFVLIVGAERRGVAADAKHSSDHEKWDFRRISAVETSPPHAPGWTRLTLSRRIGYRRRRTLVAERDVRVYRFTQRRSMFGWQAPDPSYLAKPAAERSGMGAAVPDATPGAEPGESARWPGFELPEGTRTCDIDGDVAEVVPGSWLVLEQPGLTEAYQVSSARPTGTHRFGIGGKITRATVDVTEHMSSFDRRQVLIHAGSQELPAARMPRTEPVGPGATVRIVAVEPALPAGRSVLVTGVDADTDTPAVEAATVVSAHPAPDGHGTDLVLDPPLRHRYHPDTLRVHGNVVTATHGETVEEVLGSGTGTESFPRFSLRRDPLTYVRSTKDATGAAADLTVRLGGSRWDLLPTLADAGPATSGYVVRHDEDGRTDIVFGDGVHGARVPTGVENVTATYRVGLGEPGRLDADQLQLLPRRPMGIRSVTNPAPTTDWAPPESLEDARVNAPQRIRTLDRAVSVADYEDFAAGFAGVGAARADLVWDGRRDLVVVSVLAAAGDEPSPGLLADLRATVDDAREERAAWTVLAGERVAITIEMKVEVDERYEPRQVVDAVRVALLGRFGEEAAVFATAVTPSEVLAVAAAVPGVRRVLAPRVELVPPSARSRFASGRARATSTKRVLATEHVLAPERVLPIGRLPQAFMTDLRPNHPVRALPARWEPTGGLLPAQALLLRPGDLRVVVVR